MGEGWFVVKSGSVPTGFVSDFSVEELVSQEISGLIYHSIGALGQSWHSPVVEVEDAFSIVLDNRVVVAVIMKDRKKACEPPPSLDSPPPP